ncbi:MAG: phosphate ABC transporter substrate-binding protein PstS [Gemmatimonadetes bacterium]|nr:phosphate ABC transporter substrate-binding protein PstS [Gemmatimonadota bacterium]
MKTLGMVVIAVAVAGPLAAQANLNGAGATFPNPIYTKWFDAYAKKTGIKINYQSIGSGGGIRQFTQGTVDFGASDSPMTDEQIASVKGNAAHIPTVLGAVVLTYNLPAVGATKLKLDAPTIADIFLGKITKWNDPRIAALNPGAKLPATDLLVVHRSDGSGTTFVFVDYLSKVWPEWRTKVGAANAVNWPTGLGGKGNEGVTQQVKQLEGTIGYVELVYALANKLQYASVKNQAGKMVDPTLETVTAAAASAKLPKTTDFRVSITDAPGDKAYPIASFTWLLVQADNADAVKGKQIRDFLNWMVSGDAQKMATDLGYAPLPGDVAGLVEARVKTLMATGKAIS